MLAVNQSGFASIFQLFNPNPAQLSKFWFNFTVYQYTWRLTVVATLSSSLPSCHFACLLSGLNYSLAFLSALI